MGRQIVSTLWFRINMVRTTRRLRIGPRNIRSLRRPNHTKRQGDALRLSRRQHQNPTLEKAVQRSPRPLPLLLKGHMRKMHPTLPRKSHHGSRPRQEQVHRVPSLRDRRIRRTQLRLQRLRLRTLPDRCSLRIKDSNRTRHLTERLARRDLPVGRIGLSSSL